MDFVPRAVAEGCKAQYIEVSDTGDYIFIDATTLNRPDTKRSMELSESVLFIELFDLVAAPSRNFRNDFYFFIVGNGLYLYFENKQSEEKYLFKLSVRNVHKRTDLPTFSAKKLDNSFLCITCNSKKVWPVKVNERVVFEDLTETNTHDVFYVSYTAYAPFYADAHKHRLNESDTLVRLNFKTEIKDYYPVVTNKLMQPCVLIGYSAYRLDEY